MEAQSRRNTVIKRQRADGGDLPKPVIEQLKHLLALGGREAQVKQGLGGGDVIGTDGGLWVGHGGSSRSNWKSLL